MLQIVQMVGTKEENTQSSLEWGMVTANAGKLTGTQLMLALNPKCKH